MSGHYPFVYFIHFAPCGDCSIRGTSPPIFLLPSQLHYPPYTPKPFCQHINDAAHPQALDDQVLLDSLAAAVAQGGDAAGVHIMTVVVALLRRRVAALGHQLASGKLSLQVRVLKCLFVCLLFV